MVAHPLHDFFFQDPQQFYLGGQGQISDLIKEKISAAARFETAFAAADGRR